MSTLKINIFALTATLNISGVSVLTARQFSDCIIAMKKRGDAINHVPKEKRDAFLTAFNGAIEDAGLTPSALAQMMDAKPSWLTRILKAERGMDIYDFFRICEILGARPDKIIGTFPVQENPEGKCLKVAKRLNDAIPDDLWEELKSLREKQAK